MFDRFLICEDTLRNVEQDGETVGYEFDVRIGYYRGVRLALVEEIDVSVDGEVIPRDRRTFTVDGQTFTFDELEPITHLRWEMGAPATIGVRALGGLPAGEHTVAVHERIRISYGRGYAEAEDTKQLTVQG